MPSPSAHALSGLVGYLMVFFAIWWAWMNFTWFASAYDCDDVPYRLAVFVQIAGALVFAAGVPAMFESTLAECRDRRRIRRHAARARRAVASRGAADPDHRRTALRYAFGVSVAAGRLGRDVVRAPSGSCRPSWCLRSPSCWFLSGPSGPRMTPWHPHHIAERYGLFTLIVLGESILAATTAIQAALGSGQALAELVPIIVGGLLIVYVMWWVYFDWPLTISLPVFRARWSGDTDTISFLRRPRPWAPDSA